MALEQRAEVIREEDTEVMWLGGFGVRYLVEGGQTGGDYALVEHPIRPRALAAETHIHAREDEVSYVVEGEVGVQLDGREFVARAGDVIFKPRNVPHAFWNAGDTPARIIDLITPAGFEQFFREIAPLAEAGWDDPESLERLGEIGDRYGLTFPEGALEDLVERHGLSV